MATTTAVFLAKITSDASQAVSEFRKVDGQVDRTTTSSIKKFDQFSTLAKGAMVGLAAGAGTALVAFGAQAVAEFQEVALGAGKLRDSLGLTAEEASRLQEVGADLGISTGALEANLNRMNRTAASSPEKFDAIGAAIQRNVDGTVNVNETFLNTIDALNKIPDASKRAQKAQEIFGRSWMDVAELVGLGADGVREAMAGVEDAKVIDDDEIAKARKFRDALDGLKGVAESLTIEIGGALVPALTEAAETMTRFSRLASSLKLPEIAEWATKLGPLGAANKLIDVYEGIGGAVGGLFTEEKKVADYASTFTQSQDMVAESIAAAGAEFDAAQAEIAKYETAQVSVADSIGAAVVAQERQNAALDAQRDRFESAADSVYALHDAEYAAARAIEAANEALATEGGDLYEIRQQTEQAAVAIGKLADEQVEATGVTRDSALGQRRWTEAMLVSASTLAGPVQKEVLAYIGRMNGIPEEKITHINAQDNASAALTDHLARLGMIPREVTTRIRVTGQTVTRSGDSIGVRAIGNSNEIQVRHSGGTVDGPPGSEQLVLAMAGETVLPTHKPGWDGGGAMSLPSVNSSVTMTIAPGAIVINGNASGDDVVDKLATHVRRNGPGGIRNLLGV
jgi:hypothetical protein